MASKIDSAIKTYKKLAKIPAIASGQILNNGVINSIWSQRNLEKGKTAKFLRAIVLNENLQKINETIPIDVSTELLSKISPSEKLRAVLRENENNQMLEIWKRENLIRAVDLNTLDVHGNVYTDVEFTTFEWSKDETKLLYVAEKKQIKSEPFYKRKSDKPNNGAGDEPKPKGEEYLYRQDWGEQLVGKIQSILCEYDIENDKVTILKGLPENICVAKAKYSQDLKYIIGVAYKTEPRKLGLIYCTNRNSTLFQLDFEGNYFELSLPGKAVKSPRFTPDGKHLIWLQRNAGGPHACCFSLMKTAFPLTANSKPEVVIDAVETEIQTDNKQNFYGLYNDSFPARCWASNNRLILSTIQQNVFKTYVINTDNSKITELTYNDGSQIVLDVFDDKILAVRRNFFIPDKLVIGKLTENNSVTFTDITSSDKVEELENKIFNYLELEQTDGDVKKFNAIYLGPEKGADKTVPLIVWPHGGPHSAYGNYLFLEEAVFLSFGYAILLINYRGSIGAGQKSVNFLPGKVGTSDVADCILATDTALKKYPHLNPDALCLVGGSHGGFLVAHLSGQYPDKFKAVVARNPVIDVASMSIISDIPDWCYVEGGEEYTQIGEVSEDILIKMRRASPIVHAHKVKAPTLLQIGSKDLRVPPHQGTDYYHRLKANNATVSMNLYDDNHPLGTVPNEMDNIINTLLWLEKYVPAKNK